MNIESPRFGTLVVEPERIIEFPRGLVGLEHCKRFSLFHPEGEAPTYFILQSLDDIDMAFYVTDPAQYGFAHEISLSDAEAAEIDFDGSSDAAANLAIVVILTKTPDSTTPTANLNAPLVINLASRRGLQHVFARLNYSVAATPAAV